MVDRPKIEKPRLQMWKNDDDQMSELIVHLQDKVLNVQEWDFYAEKYDKEFSYNDLLRNIAGDEYPDKEWIECMRVIIRALPDHMTKLDDDINTVLKRFTLNLQERTAYIKQFEDYANEIEQENEDLREQIAEMEKNTVSAELQQQIAALGNKLESFETDLAVIRQATKPQFPNLPDLPPDKPKQANQPIVDTSKDVEEAEVSNTPPSPKKKREAISHDSISERWSPKGKE